MSESVLGLHRACLICVCMHGELCVHFASLAYLQQLCFLPGVFVCTSASAKQKEASMLRLLLLEDVYAAYPYRSLNLQPLSAGHD